MAIATDRESPVFSIGGGDDAPARAIRSSGLMLVGRVLSLGLNFLSQILIVRYLSKSDYGAFAYVFSLLMLLKGLALLGLPDTIMRYLPVYRERAQFGALIGTLRFALGAVVGVGAVLAAGLILVFATGGSTFVDDPTVVRLVIIMAILIPLEALSELLTPVFATFASFRSIFLRKWVLAPVLRLGVVALLVARDAGVVALAAGYLLVSATGVAIYLWMLLRLARGHRWRAISRPTYSYPVRELMTFAIPMLASGLVWLAIETTDVILLGHFGGRQAVADFRAVLPVARLTQVVILSFAIVYLPMAARAYARDDRSEMSDLYWHTSAWICVLTFPIFLLTCAFAQPLTVFLFGERYAGSAPVMALLSFAYFIPSAFGFNGATLKVFRRLRYSLAIDFGAATGNVFISLALIPYWGPLGAAISTCITMVLYNALRQYGLWRYTPIEMFPRRQLPLYLSMAAVAISGLALQRAANLNLFQAGVIAIAGSAVVGLVALRTLRLESTFPELLRLPLVRVMLRPFMGPV